MDWVILEAPTTSTLKEEKEKKKRTKGNSSEIIWKTCEALLSFPFPRRAASQVSLAEMLSRRLAVTALRLNNLSGAAADARQRRRQRHGRGNLPRLALTSHRLFARESAFDEYYFLILPLAPANSGRRTVDGDDGDDGGGGDDGETKLMGLCV